MMRRIIQIDQDKCNGCGACADACHEGAIGMIDGKATLLRDDYCDGLGDCLPTCPTNAITFVEREAAEYDEAAVEANKKKKMQEQGMQLHQGGCPGSRARALNHGEATVSDCASAGAAVSAAASAGAVAAGVAGVPAAQPVMQSQLRQWPVQIKLAPINAPYFNGAKLLIAADCTAYAYAAFHNDFIKGHATLVGCPKLDMVDYSEKLTEIIKNNDIKSVHIVRMEVPCCGGMEMAAKKALQASGKFLPWQVTTISVDGKILD